jgi:hypothetical protein
MPARPNSYEAASSRLDTAMVTANQPSPELTEISQCCGYGQELYCAMSRSHVILFALVLISSGDRPLTLSWQRWHHHRGPKRQIQTTLTHVYIVSFASSRGFLSIAGTCQSSPKLWSMNASEVTPKFESPAREDEYTQHHRVVFVHHLVRSPACRRLGASALTSGGSTSDDGWLTSISVAGEYRMVVFDVLAIWCWRKWPGVFGITAASQSCRYASCSLWVVIVVGLVSGAPRDQISSVDKGLEACRQTLGGWGQC